MTYLELEQMSVEARADYFRTLPLATLLVLAGEEAAPVLDEVQMIPGLDLSGAEEQLAAHNRAKKEMAGLMSILYGN